MSTAPSPDLVGGGETPAARVRGLRTAEAAATHLCLHCGTPLATSAARTAGFCCAGCRYVHRLVHEQGLEGYYRLRDAVIAPADPAVFEPRDYAWLVEMQAAAERQTDGTPELTLEVQGISCAGCVWLIEKVFHQQPGALYIETDAQGGRVQLKWTRGGFEAAEFARKLQALSYLLGPPGEEPTVPESRRLVRRIGLCAALSMNVMLFTLPVYFGMEQAFAWAPLFGTLSFGLATLSVLAGGSYFFQRAWRALCDGMMHIDLPIAVGIIGAYAGSVYGWISGQESLVYFDFVAAFILLMLVGRWAQVVAVERNRRRLLSRQVRPQRVRVADGHGGWTEKSVEELASGDTMLVRAGQMVPVEAVLETASATLGTAWITGESAPRTAVAGQRVPGGAMNVGRGEIRLRALQPWHGSLLAHLLRPTQRDGYRHRFLENIIRGYLLGIFVVALATGVGWWAATHDAAQTWSAVTAVLVVSCPCAIGLAFPLADEMAAVALRRWGVFVREADVWPRLARIRKLIFDKTGTLTLETPTLANPAALAALAPAARAALAALVRDNAHPVSQCLQAALLAEGDANALPAGAEISEETGFGVRLKSNGALWSLGRPGWRGGAAPALVTEGHDTEFACDGVVLARFQFTDAVRANALAELAALRSRGLEIYILSGDNHAKVTAMAGLLGLPEDHAVAGATPGEKAAWIRKIDARDTLMLGDGANDSLAFDAAFARGTPVIHRGVLEAKSDFYYLGHGLEGLRRLFEVNQARRLTQRALLVFSVAYNALAVGLAAGGMMNPLLAAILMPVSSLLSLAIVIGGMRRWL